MANNLEIVPYKEIYSNFFYTLNAAWLKKYFYIEPYDEKVLSNPNKYILDSGGFIFFALYNSEVVGVVSLIKQNDFYELSKMAVDPKFQGLKIGHCLVKHCISFGRQKAWKNIILYSHRSLETAIYLYKKLGFIEIPLEKEVHYERANIKMEITL